MKRKLFKFFYLLLGAMVLLSCKDEMAATITEEPLKDIAGTWRIVTLTRNGEDLSQRIDLSKFKILFDANGNYTMQDKMAFVVSEPGSYKLNDPQYPSGLILSPQGKTAQSIKLQFPVIEGKRQLSLTLSPGCAGNTYQYNFVREN
ncbi:DUF5004 domain-containing protein [Pedobacter sp.]|uniref:DUF5004 domain-containing protein n=1 Tax=Pedobacter sp. TaxID=1411316 RepID=UPI003D7F9BD8